MTDSERIAALEVEVKHLREDVSGMSEKVTSMHDIMMQARGAKWALWGVASVAGFAAGKLSGVIPWLPK